MGGSAPPVRSGRAAESCPRASGSRRSPRKGATRARPRDQASSPRASRSSSTAGRSRPPCARRTRWPPSPDCKPVPARGRGPGDRRLPHPPVPDALPGASDPPAARRGDAHPRGRLQRARARGVHGRDRRALALVQPDGSGRRGTRGEAPLDGAVARAAQERASPRARPAERRDPVDARRADRARPGRQARGVERRRRAAAGGRPRTAVWTWARTATATRRTPRASRKPRPRRGERERKRTDARSRASTRASSVSSSPSAPAALLPGRRRPLRLRGPLDEALLAGGRPLGARARRARRHRSRRPGRARDPPGAAGGAGRGGRGHGARAEQPACGHQHVRADDRVEAPAGLAAAGGRLRHRAQHEDVQPDDPRAPGLRHRVRRPRSGRSTCTRACARSPASCAPSASARRPSSC